MGGCLNAPPFKRIKKNMKSYKEQMKQFRKDKKAFEHKLDKIRAEKIVHSSMPQVVKDILKIK